MADPFSAAGSVVGVVSLGITVAQGLVNYYGAWKDCGDDVRSTLASLQDLSTTLEILRSQLSQAQRPQNHVLHLEKTIGSCADAIARLDHKLEKIQKHRKLGQFERLRYPFRRGTIGKLQDLIAELRGNLQLLLEVLQVDVASTQTVKLDHVTSTLVGLDQKVDDFQSKEELRQIRLWLNAPDPRVNHAVARQKHEPQTGSWFVDSGHFSSWLTLPNSTYWLHGLPGCGKTILSSTIIERAKQRSMLNARSMTCFFYFDFNNGHQQTLIQLLCCLLGQMLPKSPSCFEILRSLYCEYGQGTSCPAPNSLIACLHKALGSFDDIFVVIDALDECTTTEELMTFLETAIEWELPSLHLLLTSRKTIEIDEVLTTLVQASAALTPGDIDPDIQRYLSRVLRDDKDFKRWDRKSLAEIEDVLAKRASGMFRWVSCQLESLRSCRRYPHLKKALQNLPTTLDETYEKIISKIPEVYLEDTRRVLHWLCFSFEPLSISQISDALAVEHLEGDEPRFDPRNGLLDPVKDLLTMCGSLVSMGTSQPDPSSERIDDRAIELRLSHFSVKEYLLSDRPKALRLVREDGDELLAQSCLAYLLYFEGRVPMNRQMNDDFPLAAYASRNWMKHHQRASRKETRNMNDLLERFAHSKAAILTAVRLYDPSASRGESTHFGQSLHMIALPLYYMANAGILGQTRRMIENGADVNAAGGHFGTALQAASYNGDDIMVQLLIASGASVNQEAGRFSSALCAAVAAHGESTVKVLLTAGADVNTSCSQPGRDILTYPDLYRSAAFEKETHEAKNFSALQLACDSGHIQVVRLLVENAVDINATDGNGRGALHCASRRLHMDIMRYLLHNGALVDGRGTGTTPLQELVDLIGLGTEQGINWLSAAIHVLLQSGADVNRVSCYRAIESHYKSEEAPDHLVDALLRRLIKRGCNVEDVCASEEDCRRRTALHLAAELGNERLTALLLAAGVKRATLDGNGRDSYFVAMGNGNVAVARLLKDEGQVKTSRDKYGQNPVFMATCHEEKATIELLQAEGYDLDAKDNDGHTPLWDATQNDDLAKVKCLASLGCDLHTMDGRGATLLHISMQHCPWLDLFGFLVNNGLNVDAQDRDGRSPIHYLAEYCDAEHRYGHMIEGLKTLLANGANFNMQDKMGRTVAHLLARSMHQKLDNWMLEILLLADTDLTLRDDENQSPWEALMIGPIPQGLKWLLSGGVQRTDFGIANAWFALTRSLRKEDLKEFEVNLARLPSVDFGGPDDSTPLHCAVKQGRLDAVKMLVDQKANINSLNVQGRTPLHIYVLHFNLEPDVQMIRYLLYHGADVMLSVDYSDDTILHKRAGLMTTVKDNLEIFRTLIEDAKLPVDINRQNGYGNTPLICAVGGHGGLPIVEYLCSKNADVLRSNFAGVTALGRAVILGELQMVEVLCRSGAAVNVNSAQTLYSKQHPPLPEDAEELIPPLHAAAMIGNIKIIEYLLCRGADVQLLDTSGANVIHWAARGGQPKAAKFFIKYGVDYNLKNDAGETPLDECAIKMRARVNRGWVYDPGVEDYLRFGVEGESDGDDEQVCSESDDQEGDGEEDDGRPAFDDASDKVEVSEQED